MFVVNHIANIQKIQNIQSDYIQKIHQLYLFNMEQTELTRRFIDAIKYIRENVKDGDKLENNASIAKKINVSPSYITEAEKGRTNVKIQKIQGICSVFSVSRDWLEFGYGKMISSINDTNDFDFPADENGVIKMDRDNLEKYLSSIFIASTDKYFEDRGISLFRGGIIEELNKEIKKKDKLIEALKYPISSTDEVHPITEGGIMMVPLVNQYAHAGYMSGYADAVYIESLPKTPWVVDHEYKGKYVSFEVRGDSMDDGLKHSYEQGDVLLCREIYQDYWKSKLHFNSWDAFVIVHKTDGIVVKQIVAHDVENGIITVHSFNPLYEDYKIYLREVAQIFNVVKQQKNK